MLSQSQARLLSKLSCDWLGTTSSLLRARDRKQTQVLSRERRCSWSSADAPTTSEWSTILLSTNVAYIRRLVVQMIPMQSYICSIDPSIVSTIRQSKYAAEYEGNATSKSIKISWMYFQFFSRLFNWTTNSHDTKLIFLELFSASTWRVKYVWLYHWKQKTVTLITLSSLYWL